MFLPYLTVLRLITTVWPENSENSYLHQFSAQVSQIVFLAYLTVLRLFTTVWPKDVRKLISPPFKCTSITNRVLTLFDRFTIYYNCKTWNVRKLIFPFQCTKITNRFLAYLTVLRLITPVRPKLSENSYLHQISAQVSQIVFLAYLTVLRLITTIWPEMSENSYLRHFSAQVSQIVFFAFFTFLWLITTLWP